MLILLSPAKTLDFATPFSGDRSSVPKFLADANFLVERLRQLSAQEVSALMKISDKLGQLNAERFETWQNNGTPDNYKPALLAFQGDVYQGMDVASLSLEDLGFAQEHLRILSGLYGILRPLDLIQPYRLEMGTKLAQLQELEVNNLYEFWQDKPTQAINQQLAKLRQSTVVNLASKEYSKVVQLKTIEGKVVTPVFKDWKQDKYKIVSFYAKKARGMMAGFIVRHKLQDVAEIKQFAEGGYRYNEELSAGQDWVFTRGRP